MIQAARTIAAGGTLALALWLVWLSPMGVDMPGGWFTPILAVEFATTVDDVAFLTPALRDALAHGQRIDMVFPFFYGGLLVATGLCHPGRTARMAAVSGALAVPLDLVENMLIASILEGTDVDFALTWLPLATWAKWLVIVASLVALAPPRPRWQAILLVLPAPLAVVAVVTGQPMLCEGMALTISVAFLLLIGLAWPSGAGQRGSDPV